MSTLWSTVITDSALLFIDDVRLQEHLESNPAQFFRRMTLYINAALPMLRRPPELYNHLNFDVVMPGYDDYEWVSTEESTSSAVVVQTDLIGYDMCSCVTRSYDQLGNVVLAPYTGFEYNSENGQLTISQQESAGVEYDFDFYKDGYFQDLTPTMMRLLGLAIACVWDERFERNWLNIQMKVKDDSFTTVNESHYMEKANERKRENMKIFNDELRKYEQDCAFYASVPMVDRRTRFI